MAGATYEVAQVLERNKERLGDCCHNSWQLRTLHAVRKCRTAALGGHIDRCGHDGCNKLHLSYNSCRNRHCPKCQGHKGEQWVRAREQELLNVPYYHVVFTLPGTLNPLCLYRPRLVYNLLFRVAWSVVKDFGNNPKFMGAQTGMTAILHTWGQHLSLHPHLHCIVPGGGINKQGRWKAARGKGKYLFPVKAMGKVFQSRFVAALRKETDLGQDTYDALFAKDWVVYCKRPFATPHNVLEYLGRYTHKIAISNHRIKGLKDGQVHFTAKDYRRGGAKHLLSLNDGEFIRRFCLHILPKGFVRIRHYGMLSSSKKKVVIPLLGQQLGKLDIIEKPLLQHRLCPSCKKGKLHTVAVFDSRGPPEHWLKRLDIPSPKNETIQ